MRRRGLLMLMLLSACSGQKPPPPPTTTVSVGIPLQRQVIDWDDYVGRFEAVQTVNILPRVSGTVTKIAFHQGVEVKRGQQLFEIDPRPYRAAFDQAVGQEARAQATLVNAQSELARANKLVAVSAISKEEQEQKIAAVRTAEADVTAAKAAAAARKLDLDFTVIRAPISGRVSDKRVSLGDTVAAGQTLLTTIVSINPIWFTFEGAESFYLKYIRQAQQGERPSSRYAPNPVQIQLADEKNYRWNGRMIFVDNAIDASSGTIRARAEVANPDGFLVPGMFGRARLLGSGRYRALLVPDEAVVTDQTRRIVYVLSRDSTVVQRPVETGPLVEGLRVIKEGVSPNDRVVLDGLARLQPNMKVDSHLVRLQPRAAADDPGALAATAPPSSEATVH
jgi:RND family efflux transporter MFP subunit